MSVITDNAAIDAKAQAELATVLAMAGVRHDQLTDIGRALFQQGYKLGYAQGARDASVEACAIVGTKA